MISENGLYFNNTTTLFKTVLPLKMSFTNYNQGLLFFRTCSVKWNNSITLELQTSLSHLLGQEKWMNDYHALNTFNFPPSTLYHLFTAMRLTSVRFIHFPYVTFISSHHHHPKRFSSYYSSRLSYQGAIIPIKLIFALFVENWPLTILL